MKRSRAAAVLAASVALPPLVARAQNAGPYAIGATFPLTGPFAAISGEFLKGAQIAVEDVNAAGGVGGRKLQLLTEDSQASQRLPHPLADGRFPSVARPSACYPGTDSFGIKSRGKRKADIASWRDDVCSLAFPGAQGRRRSLLVPRVGPQLASRRESSTSFRSFGCSPPDAAGLAVAFAAHPASGECARVLGRVVRPQQPFS